MPDIQEAKCFEFTVQILPPPPPPISISVNALACNLLNSLLGNQLNHLPKISSFLYPLSLQFGDVEL